jgi:hypothetical protein
VPDTWTKLANSRAKKFNNKCHSENRANCYDTSSGTLSDVRSYERQTEQAHLFYNAPPCAVNVLSSSFINLSIMTLLITLVSLLLF